MAGSRRERALAIAGGRTLVTADPASVTWLTGLAVDVEWGPTLFSVPPIAILAPDGRARAVVSEDEAGGLAPDVEALTYPGFALEDVDRRAAAARAAISAVPESGPLAVELASLAGNLVHALDPARLEDVGAELQRARAVKDDDELGAIRQAIRAADAGHAAARVAAAPGRSELELWAETRAAIEAAAGGRTPVHADFVSGPRTAEIGGPPGDRRLADDDLLLVDLAPRVGGYWGDSCSTVALGAVPGAVQEAHAAAREALEAAKQAVRPGAVAGDVDAAARAVVEAAGGSYPHHTGHGVGLAMHEEPRIFPGSERVLEAGMVVALEPGTYAGDWGVRVEQVVLVTPDGHELLSGHDVSL